MHQHQLRGIGGRPGRTAAPVGIAAAARIVTAKVEALERAAGLSEEEKEDAERGYALRRAGG